jgi:CDGSH-type Zn-finger protein
MTRISVVPNGPYLIDGEAEVLDSAGKAFDTGPKPRIALCRCGQSRNKPLCDGSHKAGFTAQETAPRKP